MSNGKARYVSRYPNLVLTMHGGGSQPMLNTTTGLQELHVVDPRFIRFSNYEFYTEDAEEIDFIEKCPDFTGAQGHRKIIDKAAEQDPAQVRLVDLINTHGAAKVASAFDMVEKAMEKKKAKAAAEE